MVTHKSVLPSKDQHRAVDEFHQEQLVITCNTDTWLHYLISSSDLEIYPNDPWLSCSTVHDHVSILSPISLRSEKNTIILAIKVSTAIKYGDQGTEIKALTYKIADC